MRRAPDWPHRFPVPRAEQQRLVTTAHLALHERSAVAPGNFSEVDMHIQPAELALTMRETVAVEGRLLPAGSRQMLDAADAVALLRGRLADLTDPQPTRVLMLGTIALRGRLFVEGSSATADARTALHLVRRGYARVQR